MRRQATIIVAVAVRAKNIDSKDRLKNAIRIVEYPIIHADKFKFECLFDNNTNQSFSVFIQSFLYSFICM